MTSPHPGDTPKFEAGPPAPQYPQQGYGPMGYGQPAYSQPGYGYLVQQSRNGLATAGLVCGIIGLVLFWFPFVGMILALLGIIFGGIGIAKANSGAQHKGFAIAGLVCGLIAIALYIVVISIAVTQS